MSMAGSTPSKVLVTPLWRTLLARERAALGSGKLSPIATTTDWLEDAGMRFLVRVVDSLARKAAAEQIVMPEDRRRSKRNPFLPPDPALTVGPLGPDHLCVLNKFQVIAHHALVITRNFEPQDELLSEQDLRALGICMAAVEGLGFYNAGPQAGASQRHRHLQLVPLPLAPEGDSIPLQPQLSAALGDTGEIVTCPSFPFEHAMIRVGLEGPEQAATAWAAYRALLQRVDLDPGPRGHTEPYNLLVGKGWMLLVPRTQERWENISINALGFAGALLVRDRQQAARLRIEGPLTALRAVTRPPA